MAALDEGQKERTPKGAKPASIAERVDFRGRANL